MKNKKETQKESIKKVLRVPKFSMKFMSRGSEEAGTDWVTRLGKGEVIFQSMLAKPEFYELRKRLTREAFIPWEDTKAAIEFYIRKLELKDTETAHQLKVARYEQYMNWVSDQTKEHLRHLKFEDDIELVLDEKGLFEDDHAPAFGTAYREREAADLVEESID